MIAAGPVSSARHSARQRDTTEAPGAPDAVSCSCLDPKSDESPDAGQELPRKKERHDIVGNDRLAFEPAKKTRRSGTVSLSWMEKGHPAATTGTTLAYWKFGNRDALPEERDDVGDGPRRLARPAGPASRSQAITGSHAPRVPGRVALRRRRPRIGTGPQRCQPLPLRRRARPDLRSARLLRPLGKPPPERADDRYVRHDVRNSVLHIPDGSRPRGTTR